MLLFMDGAAHYDTSRIGMKYSVMTNATCDWSIVAEGRYGNCVKRVAKTNFGGNGYLDISPLTYRNGVYVPNSSGVIGFAIKIDDVALSIPNENGGPDRLVAGLDGAHEPAKIVLNPSGTIGYVQPWGPLDGYGATMATSAEGLPSGAWSYLEFKWKIDPSAGFIEVRVNTVPILTFTGDTSSHNPTWFTFGKWNNVRLLQLQSQLGPPWLTTRHCDLYLADLTFADADDAHDFLGDGVIETIMPNGVGASTDWTPTGATANWDTVNDRPAPDNDGTYVSTKFQGLQDTYQYEDVPAASIIKGVHVNILARKEEEGSVVIAPIVRQGSTDYIGPSQGVASLVYDRYITQPYDVNPATLNPWTAAEINAGQWGVKKVL